MLSTIQRFVVFRSITRKSIQVAIERTKMPRTVLNSVPDASSVMIQLARVVRLGQTNFEFANIWEHRRTREVLIAGFRTLGDALNTLGATIEHSVSALQQSVSSDAAMVVQEGIRTGEQLDRRMLEQNRMLDSMQRR